jgi:septum formation protein
MTRIVLASTSAVRRTLLAAAGLSFTALSPGVDEEAVKTEMLAKGEGPKAVAQALADIKAERVSREMDGLVIGADQTLDLDGALFDKVPNIAAARARLVMLRGREHRLHAGVAVAKAGAVIWRKTVTTRLTMRGFSDAYLDDYLARNAEAALSSVGCYHLEGEGAQLFDTVEGDYFSILGLPLLDVMACLREHGALET